MIDANETNLNEPSCKILTQYELVSSKVELMIKEKPIEKRLRLPKSLYGPFCCRILNEFKNHFGLDQNLALPAPEDPTHVALSKIFDIMIQSMGKEKREIILRELDEYLMGVPASFRD